MRYADSIVKVYATSTAMLLTAAVGVAAFGVPPTLQMGLGIAVAAASVLLYYGTPQQLMGAVPGEREAPPPPPGGSPAGRLAAPRAGAAKDPAAEV
jgi:hypothetical protein